MHPPRIVDNAKLIAYLVLTDSNIRTGNTRHIVGGSLIKNFYGLAICQYENDKGFYLFYCDSSWKTITDTHHETIEDAKDQAEFEYTNIENNWVFLE